MIIIGLKNCPRCKLVKAIKPYHEYIEIPDISLGFGDTIAKFTKLFGFSPCEQCRLRQYKINNLIPYKWRLKRVAPKVIKAKQLAYKNGITMFPVFADDDLTEIVIK